MNNLAEQSHCPFSEKLLAYLSDDLSERDTLALEEHLHNCPECLQVALEIRDVKNTFGTLSLLNRLYRSDAESGVAEQPSILVSTVMRGIEAASDRWSETGDRSKVSRLRHWGQRLGANAQRVAQTLSRAQANLASIQSTSVAVMQELGCLWQQRLGFASISMAGPVRAGGIAESPRTAPTGIELRIERVPGSHDFEVTARGFPAEMDRLMVMLVPSDAPESAREATLRKISDIEWSARFENVAPGDYVVAIEPLANRIAD